MSQPFSYVTDGRECIGFILPRGRSGFEAFDRNERPLGLFKSASGGQRGYYQRGPADQAPMIDSNKKTRPRRTGLI
jgi:hypothetical protein